MLGIGVWAKKYIKTIDDYLLAGRRLGLVLATATLAATHYGGGFVLGGASWGVKYGIGGFWYGAACGLGLALLAITFAKLARLLAVYTVPELLYMRYRSKVVQLIAASLSLLALIGITGAQIVACGALFEAMGLDWAWGATLSAIIFITYTALSGLWAVALTDLAQIIIGSLGVVIATLLVLQRAGGLAGVASRLGNMYSTGVLEKPPSSYLDIASPGLPMIMLTLMATIMYTLIGQDFYQRLFAAKDEKTAIRASLISGIFLIALSFLPPIAGMAALAISNDPLSLANSPRTAVPKLILTVFGPVMGGLFMAAVLAAIMSTADSLLLAATSHVVRDFYYGLNKQVVGKEMVKLSIVITIVIGSFSLIAAFIVRGIIELLIYSYDLYTSGCFMPLVVGLLWKRASREGALAGMMAGIAMSMVNILGLTQIEMYELVYVRSALVSLIAMIAVSLLTKPTQPEERLTKILKWT
ncbi:MAG: sodium:solute symporter family protein [Desulfurococcaceae archaeon]